MSRLLLFLLILFPAILFGQQRQRAILDSIKLSAADLQKVSDVIGNTPGTRIEDIKASARDGSITVTVRIHVTEAVEVRALSSLPIATMKTRSVGAGRLTTLTVPPAPFIKEADTILALYTFASVKLKTKDIIADRMAALTVPPAPGIIVADTIAALALHNISNIKIAVTPIAGMDVAVVPPLPIIKDDVTAMLLYAVGQFKIEATAASKLDVVDVPPLPYIIASIEAVPVLSIIPCSIAQRSVATMNTRVVPAIPDIQTDDMLALIAPVHLAIQQPAAGKMAIGTFPDFGQKEVTVEGMHLSADGYALLEKMEGFSPELYALGDGGCTIGFGFFVPYAEIGKWRKGITWEDAERLIKQKVPQYEDQVKQYINVPLIQEEFDALTMLAYNLGGFSRATSIVNDINSNADFDKLQHDWMRFVHSKAPNVLKGLMNRRRDEMAVRRESDYQPERKVLVYKNKK